VQPFSGLSPTGLMSTFLFVSVFGTLQPGGPGSRIYFPQEQGSPVIPAGIGLGRTNPLLFFDAARIAWESTRQTPFLLFSL
jgi:hypothetical protein